MLWWHGGGPGEAVCERGWGFGPMRWGGRPERETPDLETLSVSRAARYFSPPVPAGPLGPQLEGYRLVVRAGLSAGLKKVWGGSESTSTTPTRRW